MQLPIADYQDYLAYTQPIEIEVKDDDFDYSKAQDEATMDRIDEVINEIPTHYDN